MVADPSFDVTFRGYDRAAVEQLVEAVEAGLRAPGTPAAGEAVRRLGEARFTVVLRGYDRRQVDDYLRIAGSQLGAGSPA